MPVGGSILNKYGGTPPPPKGRNAKVRVLALPLIAAIVMTIGFVWGMNSLAGRQAFIIGTGVLVVAAGVANSVRGWREDGLLGFLYRNKYPTGTALSSDEDRSTPFAFWLIVVASMAAAAVLIAMRGWPF